MVVRLFVGGGHIRINTGSYQKNKKLYCYLNFTLQQIYRITHKLLRLVYMIITTIRLLGYV